MVLVLVSDVMIETGTQVTGREVAVAALVVTEVAVAALVVTEVAVAAMEVTEGKTEKTGKLPQDLGQV